MNELNSNYNNQNQPFSAPQDGANNSLAQTNGMQAGYQQPQVNGQQYHQNGYPQNQTVNYPQQPQPSYQQSGFQGQQEVPYPSPVNPENPNAKSKVVAGVLAILLGGLGAHNFYLGHYGKAIAQLLISILSLGLLAFIPGIWGLIEGILILTSKPGDKWNQDADGIPLKN